VLNVASPVKQIAASLSTTSKLTMSRNPHGSVAALMADCVSCAADGLIDDAGGPAWDAAGFARLREAVRAGLYDATEEVVRRADATLRSAQEIDLRLERLHSAVLEPAEADIRDQLARLIRPGYLTATGYRRLPDLVRYLRGIEKRLDKLPESPGRDAMLMATVHRCEDALAQARQRLPESRRGELDDVGWMIEELRVSLFAQTLGTPAPVSERRILAALDRSK
jgi:ATP-dependent helicase HrpA